MPFVDGFGTDRHFPPRGKSKTADFSVILKEYNKAENISEEKTIKHPREEYIKVLKDKIIEKS